MRRLPSRLAAHPGSLSTLLTVQLELRLPASLGRLHASPSRRRRNGAVGPLTHGVVGYTVAATRTHVSA